MIALCIVLNQIIYEINMHFDAAASAEIKYFSKVCAPFKNIVEIYKYFKNHFF